MVAISKEMKQKTTSSKKQIKPVEEEPEEEVEQSSEEEEEEEELKIHVKNGDSKNGFNKSISNTKEDDHTNNKLKEMASDVKSKEAMENGDFKNFDLPKNLVDKLKAKGINYLYPIQVATLKHIRAGHDVIAQAS